MKSVFALLFLMPFFALAQTRHEKPAPECNQSEKALRAAVKRDPLDVRSTECLGDLLARESRWDAASDTYRKLVSLQPRDAGSHYKLGGALAMDASSGSKIRALGMISEMRTAFENAIKFNPKHIEAHWALVEYYLRLPAMFGGSESKADKYARALSRLSPVDGHLAKARIAEYFERDKQVEAHLLNAHSVGNSETTYKKLIAFYTRTKRPEKVKQVSEQYNKSTKRNTCI